MGKSEAVVSVSGRGTVMAGNAGLAVFIPQAEWSFLLRRTDLREERLFLAYHDREIGPLQVVVFIPHWKSVRWIRVADNLLSRSESTAIDGAYQVTVRAESGSGKLHEAVIDAFLGFMANRES